MDVFTSSQVMRAIEIGVPDNAIQRWVNGDLIQNAMYWLSPDQREYILTGISPEEWDEMFMESGE